jgi:hypothetical protein
MIGGPPPPSLVRDDVHERRRKIREGKIKARHMPKTEPDSSNTTRTPGTTRARAVVTLTINRVCMTEWTREVETGMWMTSDNSVDKACRAGKSARGYVVTMLSAKKTLIRSTRGSPTV